MKKVIFILVILLSACGNEEETKNKQDIHASFRNIDIQLEEDRVIVVGEVKASNDEFYYHVELDEEVIVQEEMVTVDGEWGEFQLAIDITDKMRSAETVTIVNMYTKKVDGSIVNPNYIPLDLDSDNAEN
ncbi:hypothetical protein [Ornithinibacillus californiensis]|uniref:hypothetical protein n=1 Tax=Ornithinibacillus californiensis TaxID=161536 RepID=UPI00064DABCD|nr:hypothetical protein [Ornithinibacillus californiensis]